MDGLKDTCIDESRRRTIHRWLYVFMYVYKDGGYILQRANCKSKTQ